MATILIIEDDQQLRNMLQEMLAEEEHKVLTAQEGQEGLSLFPAHTIDLVVTDILMPGKEGLETIRELQSEHPSTKIIAYSGGQNERYPGVLNIAKKLGAALTLTKPFSHGDLLQAVRTTLGESVTSS